MQLGDIILMQYLFYLYVRVKLDVNLHFNR